MEENQDFGYGLRREFWHRGIVTEAEKSVAEQDQTQAAVFCILGWPVGLEHGKMKDTNRGCQNDACINLRKQTGARNRRRV